ncbi:YjgF-like protein [Aspergillus homomorphus CBS 101889]|uniref:YjgF-like protein n=1 Tax=Aspergillus homomorphus (strain CBS 101889) TaxID=1450537 RepID=A0A395HZ79_ASPHC|nr:YjgF-like protein [Aspergillus homomorphus CBS 101889]RAL13100.1 YjgF-like protein [Aspergillus homomorphus CBS 101889]
MLYCSGSLGIDPRTGAFVAGDVVDRTVQSLRNLKQVLIAGGSDLSKVVKVTIFVSSMAHYAKVNEGYAKVFGAYDVKPCRTCVGVASLPLDAEVEFELVATIWVIVVYEVEPCAKGWPKGHSV